MSRAVDAGLFNNLLKSMTDFFVFLGGMTLLTQKTLRELFEKPFYFRLLIDQIYQLGVKSLYLVFVTSMATGSVMALQFGYGLARFGGKLFVPKIVALSILREMGPVFTSLLVAGRIGSGMAAEIGAMHVSQQIDAIRALGTSPIKRIVIPRLLACLIVVPLLTAFADMIALLGSMLVCAVSLSINPEYFFIKATETLRIVDLVSGLAKAAVFAFFIAICACYRGLNTSGGTEGVGVSTTQVVVSCSVFIMLSDFALTQIFLIYFFPRL
jgi:phospholipid/cholesterol/gamma-HCH transport system permease protein